MIFSAASPSRRGLVLSTGIATNWKFGEFISKHSSKHCWHQPNKGLPFPFDIQSFSLNVATPNWEERKKIMNAFIVSSERNVRPSRVADREFISERNGQDAQQPSHTDLTFEIRQISGLVQSLPTGERIRAWWLFNDLKVGQEKFFHKLFLHKGEYVYLAGSRIKNSDGVPELQILICFNRPEEAILTYKKRWEIETAFRAMKSSGFNIEDTHMRDMDRIARLVAMVCMALVWAYLVGEHKDINIKPIRILKHGRKEKSLVKYGLEEISTILLRPTYTPKFDVCKFLSCT